MLILSCKMRIVHNVQLSGPLPLATMFLLEVISSKEKGKSKMLLQGLVLRQNIEPLPLPYLSSHG